MQHRPYVGRRRIEVDEVRVITLPVAEGCCAGGWLRATGENGIALDAKGTGGDKQTAPLMVVAQTFPRAPAGAEALPA